VRAGTAGALFADSLFPQSLSSSVWLPAVHAHAELGHRARKWLFAMLERVSHIQRTLSQVIMKKIHRDRRASTRRRSRCLCDRYRRWVFDTLTWQDILAHFSIEPAHVTQYGTILLHCPFHEGPRDPKISIGRPRRPDLWHCWYCGEGGDKVDFILAYSGLQRARVAQKKAYIASIRRSE